MTSTLKGRPASCSTIARLAIAGGIILGEPAGPKPPIPKISPFWMYAAASSAVRKGSCIYNKLDYRAQKYNFSADYHTSFIYKAETDDGFYAFLTTKNLGRNPP
jgi:hypothetical protein